MRAVERRKRKVYVPGALAPLSALRYLLASPLSERIMRRNARRLVPQAEGEARALNRAFGSHSVETRAQK